MFSVTKLSLLLLGLDCLVGFSSSSVAEMIELVAVVKQNTVVAAAAED